MAHNVKKALSVAIRRLLRPLVRIMLREGLTYPQFAAIARRAFIHSARIDFAAVGGQISISSISALTGIPQSELSDLAVDKTAELDEISSEENYAARVLHGWHNDRDYVGPYGFPMDLPFYGVQLSLSALVSRHAPEISPEVVLHELQRISAVRRVGENIWQPTKQEFIDPTFSPENIQRMAKLVESLLSTLENNTRAKRDGTDLFERTMVVDVPLSKGQLLALQQYVKVVGGQFLHRIDAYAALDLKKQVALEPGELGSTRAGLQCFLFIESNEDDSKFN